MRQKTSHPIRCGLCVKRAVPTARTKADFYFLGRSLKFLTTLLDTARLRAKAIHRVAAFAVTYNIAAAGLCLAGLMNPLLAAILMPLSGVFTLAVVAAHFATPIRR